MSGIDFLPLAVFAFPLLALLIASIFHVDEIAARPNKRVARYRRAPRVDEFGSIVCPDPDGRCYNRAGNAC